MVIFFYLFFFVFFSLTIRQLKIILINHLLISYSVCNFRYVSFFFFNYIYIYIGGRFLFIYFILFYLFFCSCFRKGTYWGNLYEQDKSPLKTALEFSPPQNVLKSCRHGNPHLKSSTGFSRHSSLLEQEHPDPW